ncbi:MAG: hypothetical protein AAF790_15750, partial [Planctomycetota bacterium]
PGMTRCRQALLDAGVPMVGNLPGVMATAADKWATRQAAAAAGIRVPAGERLLGPGPASGGLASEGSAGEDLAGEAMAGCGCSLPLPVVVKPATADNSSGVTLVREASRLPAAVAAAARHSPTVFAEQYIPAGREVRCGVLQTERGLLPLPLPLQEYAVDEHDHPIRNLEDKLVTTGAGRVDLASKHGSRSWIVAAADPITPAVQQAALACYAALDCRHYGLFDFRVDPAGVVWLLEAGLYCSFAPKSVLVMMAAAAGVSREAFLRSMIGLAGKPTHGPPTNTAAHE